MIPLLYLVAFNNSLLRMGKHESTRLQEWATSRRQAQITALHKPDKKSVGIELKISKSTIGQIVKRSNENDG